MPEVAHGPRAVAKPTKDEGWQDVAFSQQRLLAAESADAIHETAIRRATPKSRKSVVPWDYQMAGASR
jgi:hypothetical protein